MKLNQEFDSYDEFEREFKNYCDETFQCFTTTDSRYHDDKSVKYKHFKCVHHNEPESVKSKSKGIRPCQHYLASGCKVELRVSSNKKLEKILI